MSFTIGGRPIVMDYDHQIAKFMAEYQPLENIADFYHGYSESGQSGVLPLDDWNDTPSVGLNELYWPTGASRFALGYFLMRRTDIEALGGYPFEKRHVVSLRTFEDQGDGEEQGGSSGGTPSKIDIEMLIGWRAIASSKDLYLVMAVDERFLWRTMNMGSITISDTTTWEMLYSSSFAAGPIGKAIEVSTIAPAYLQPDPGSLGKSYSNVAHFLDAVAHSIGHRIVRRLNGDILSMSWRDSSEAFYDNMEDGVDLKIAGTPSFVGPALPETIDVIFPGSENHFACCSEPYKISFSSGSAFTPGSVKTIRSSCYADYTTNGEGGVPDNFSELNDLAMQLLGDHALRLNADYDVTFQGIRDWKLGGYDDSIWFRIGSQPDCVKGDKWLCSTRIQSIRVNGEPETQLSQSSFDILKCGFYVAKVTEEITAAVDGVPGEGKVEIYERNDGSGNLINTDIEVSVFNLSETVFEGPDEIEETEGEWVHINVDGYCTPWVIPLAGEGGVSVVASLNSPLTQWDNADFTPGCEVLSCVIVAACGTDHEIGETIDVLFIRQEGREVNENADWIVCVPANLEADPPLYIAAEGYLKGESIEAKVVQMNTDVPVWDNGEPEAEDEYEHGCETVSGEIVEPCSATVPDPATAVDVVFIRREGREPDLKEDDRIQCVPLDLEADPPRYLAVGEYLKAEGGAEHYGVTLLEDVGETTAGEVSATIYEMDFTTEVESTATVLDNGGIFDGGEEGANGIAVKIGDDYHLIQLGCEGSS